MSDWVTRAHSTEGAPFEPSANVREALIVLGTNNLNTLVRFIAYDPAEGIWIPLFRVMPRRINQMSIFDFVTDEEERRNGLADDAVQVFYVLGPLGAPAVPELGRILGKSGPIPGNRALQALNYIGEQSLPAIISAAGNTQCPTRFNAIRSLWAHTNSVQARTFLTKALNDPNSHVRSEAGAALNGEQLQ